MTNREIEKALKPGAPKPRYGHLVRWCLELLAELKQVTEQRDFQYPGGLPALLKERDQFKAEVERLRAQLASYEDFLKLSNEAVEREANELDRLRAPSPCGVEGHKGGADWVNRRVVTEEIIEIDEQGKVAPLLDRRQHDLGGHCEACERERVAWLKGYHDSHAGEQKAPC